MDVLFPALAVFLRHLSLFWAIGGQNHGVSSAKTAESARHCLWRSLILYLFVVYYSRQNLSLCAPTITCTSKWVARFLCFSMRERAGSLRGTHDRIARSSHSVCPAPEMIETIRLILD